MKTNNNSESRFKNTYHTTVDLKSITGYLYSLLILFLFAGNSYAQLAPSTMEISHNTETNKVADTSVHITSFTVRIVSENNYLKWSVYGLKQDGTFTVHHSCDGINYSYVGSKPAIGVPVNINITYYFDFKVSITEDNYYMILYTNNEQSEYLMCTGAYVCDEKLIVQAK